MRFARDNSLSIFFLAIFLASLAGQAIAGHGQFNHDQLLHHGDPISLGWAALPFTLRYFSFHLGPIARVRLLAWLSAELQILRQLTSDLQIAPQA